MALPGKQINLTFRSLLRIPDDTNGVTASLQGVEDGEGTPTPLEISQTQVNITGGFSIEGVDVNAAGAGDKDVLMHNGSEFEPTPNFARTDQAQEYTKAQNFNSTVLTGLGADLVTNGGFATDTDWSKGTGWTIASNVASSDGTQAGNADLTQAISITNGNTYEVTFTVSNYSAGNIRPVVGNTEGTNRAANGTFTEQIVAAGGTDLDMRADLDFIGDIDDVIVKEVNIAWNAEDNQVTEVTLDSDLILDNPTNIKDGGTYILRVKQDATGTRLLTFGSAYRFAGGGTPPTLSTDPNAVDYLTFISDGTNMDGVFTGDFS